MCIWAHLRRYLLTEAALSPLRAVRKSPAWERWRGGEEGETRRWSEAECQIFGESSWGSSIQFRLILLQSPSKGNQSQTTSQHAHKMINFMRGYKVILQPIYALGASVSLSSFFQRSTLFVDYLANSLYTVLVKLLAECLGSLFRTISNSKSLTQVITSQK